MKTCIISAFPCSGKTYASENLNNNPYTILDTDPKDFLFKKDESGCTTNSYNPKFPNNYINYIKENIGKYDVIFISSDEVVRDALKVNGIKFFLIKPENNLKDKWIDRMTHSSYPESTCQLVTENWDELMNRLNDCADENCMLNVLFEERPYIDNVILSYFFNVCHDYVYNIK